MGKANEIEKKKMQEHLEKVQKDADQKIKIAEEKANNEKLKAEEVIKQATKMILDARSKKSEITTSKKSGAAEK
jgi:hypothetical protein